MLPRLSFCRTWWCAGLILATATGAFYWNGSQRDVIYEQQRVMASLAIICLGLAVSWLWLVTLSPLPLKIRKLIALASAGTAILLLGLFEIRGFTGDLVPAIHFRGGSRPTLELQPAGSTGSANNIGRNPIWRNSPQFLGVERNSSVRGVQLEIDWSEHAPIELWRRPVGAGWSGFAVVGRRAITQEQRGENEAIVCYGALDGEQRWVHEVKARYGSTIAGDGPRSTPTIAGQRVLAAGGTGILSCLELSTGKELWSLDVPTLTGAKVPEWGYSCSPWVGNGQVVVSPGDLDSCCLISFDIHTGKQRWIAGGDRASYSSPTVHNIGGVPQFVTLNSRSLCGINPSDGQILWSAEWAFDNPNVCQPVVPLRDKVFVSSGYGAGCALFQISRDDNGVFSATREWKTLNLKSKLSTYVNKGGHIYGLDDGILTCINLASGRRVWKSGRYGHGQLLLVGDNIILTTEDGRVVLIAASPDKHRELASFRGLASKVWNPPAFAAPLLFLRNDEEAVCYRLPLL